MSVKRLFGGHGSHQLDGIPCRLVALRERSTDSSFRENLRRIGPGIVTGASDDDPSGIATYSQAGAQFRYGMLWLALLTFPLMAAVQEICDRTALATGKSLGTIASDHFPRWARVVTAVLVAALLIANALNIAADLVAIGAGINLIWGGPISIYSLLAGLVIVAVVMSGSFKAVSLIFKLLCLALLTYLAVLFFINVHWKEVLGSTLVPHITFSKDYLALMVAVLGTTISPYLFFWQSSYRVEEMQDEGSTDEAVPLVERLPEEQRHEERIARTDVIGGMAFSNVVMFAVILATASVLGGKGLTINSAADAASALKPVAGHSASLLFALGFVGSGFLAIPVLAGSGAAGLAGLLHRDFGFSAKTKQAPVFYGLVGLGIVGGMVLTLLHVNPIRLLIFVALVNGLAAAPFLILVMVIARREDIMGAARNGRWANILGWTTVAVMGMAAVALIATGGGL